METKTKIILGGLLGAGVAYLWWARSKRKTVRVRAMGGVSRKRMTGPGGASDEDLDAELSAMVSNPSTDSFAFIHRRCVEHQCDHADMDTLISDLEVALSSWPDGARQLRGDGAWEEATLGGWGKLVHTLDVSDMGLGPAGARRLAQMPLEGLKGLSVGGNALGARGLSSLADGLPPSVTHLSLDWEFLDEDSVDVLVGHPGFEGVRSISARNARLSPEGRSRIHERFDVALT